MYQVFIIVADCTYHFLSWCGYADRQWGILETGSRTPDLKGGLHTCPGLRVDISIVTLIANGGRAWWNFLSSYCSLCSTAVLRCTPPPSCTPHRKLLPEIMSGSCCVHSIYTDYFSLEIALHFPFFVTHVHAQVDICLYRTVILFMSISRVFYLFVWNFIFKANKWE